MSDAIAAAFDVLRADPNIGETIDYEGAAGGGVFGIRALQRPLDAEGGFDDVRISHDVRRFEIRVSDLDGLPANPTRNDRIVAAGVTYRVQTIPSKDELGLIWLIDAYRI